MDTNRSLPTAVMVGMSLLLVAGGPAGAVQSKCLVSKNKCVAKKAAVLLKCEQKAETPGKPTDPNADGCVDKAKAKFNGGEQAEKGCFEKAENKKGQDCITFDDTASAEAVVDQCVATLVAAIDSPPTDQTKCGVGKKKCVVKKLSGLLKCYQKAQTPGKPMDPNTKGCLDKVNAKFDGGEDQGKGCFVKLENKSKNDCEPPRGNQAELETLVDSCVGAFVAALENSPPTTTTTTSTTMSTTTSTSSTTTTQPATTTTSTTAPATTTTTTQPATTTTTTSSTTSTTTTTSTTSTTTTTTRPAVCGNGTVEGDEECDDGNTDPNDGCTNACTVCGNQIVTPPETCDDGNLEEFDSCPADCTIEACEPTTTQLPATLVVSTPDIRNFLIELDYPEGKVDLPGEDFTPDVTPLVPGSFQPFDLAHAIRIVGADAFNYGQQQLATLNFVACAGAEPPVASDFQCFVRQAGSENGPVTGVTCAVTIP